jgi:hypothetical protein
MTREEQLETGLIRTMMALHIHVTHCGTTFENEMLKLLDEKPHAGVNFREVWEDVAIKRGIPPRR